MTPAEEQAARIAGALWESVRFSGGTRIREHRHYPAAFGPAWLASLPLPAADAPPPGQPVALLSAATVERYPGPPFPSRACTRMLEDIARCDEGSWPALAARHLTFLSGSSLRVTCSVFGSRYGDETFGRHRDAWLGVVVQMAGAKDWLLGECPPGGAVTTRAGDILLIPKGLPHVASTPLDPGHSVHLAFAVGRDAPPP